MRNGSEMAHSHNCDKYMPNCELIYGDGRRPVPGSADTNRTVSISAATPIVQTFNNHSYIYVPQASALLLIVFPTFSGSLLTLPPPTGFGTVFQGPNYHLASGCTAYIQTPTNLFLARAFPFR